MQTFGGNLPVHSARICVVYDSHTGGIRHIHEVITLKGGRELSEAEIEAQAVEIVKRKGHHSDKLGVLHMPSEKVDRRQVYVVDLKAKTLTPKPAK
jgi:hypothetical protein